MSDLSDDEKHNADLEWLYGGRNPGPEQTRIWTQAEQAELLRRQAEQNAYQQPGAAKPVDSNVNIFNDPNRKMSTPVTPAAQQNPPQNMASVGAPVNYPNATPNPNLPHPGQYLSQGAPGAMPASETTKKKRKRHPIRNTILLLLTVAVAWVLFLVTVPMNALKKVERVNDVPAGIRPAEQPGTAILLVGSDSRSGLTKEEQQILGTGTTKGKRTDSMMILYQPIKGKPVLLSLPRDSYVQIPGHGKNKLNAAYAFGGAPLLIETVETATGIRIDGYIEIGFGGFVSLVDSVGGIDVCLDAAINDKDSHLNLPAGCQTLDGKTSLGYVRMRKQDPTGDLGRMKRQRWFMSALAKKLITKETIINPVRYWQTNQAITKILVLGENTSFGDMFSAARAMMTISKGHGIELQVPIANANARTAAGSSVLWDEQLAKELFNEIINGHTDNVEKYRKTPNR